MKTNSLFQAADKLSPLRVITLVLVGVGLLLVPPALAGLPQPMCVYYGQAKDGYGIPYRTNAEVILLHGTNEIAQQKIGRALAAGINFALYVHLDSGGTAAPYSARAVRSGDIVSIIVRDGEGQRTIMENQAVPPVGRPGDLILINATAAEDADGDGLPDQWEEELIAWSDGWLSTLSDVRAEDDFDRDGMSNLQEYRAGTFPFLDYDYLSVEWVGRTANNHLQLTFLSVPGKIYTPYSATNLMQSAWEPCPFALTDVGTLEHTPVEGNGDRVSLYLPIEEPVRFLRLEVR